MVHLVQCQMMIFWLQIISYKLILNSHSQFYKYYPGMYWGAKTMHDQNNFQINESHYVFLQFCNFAVS
jgi:hypothetical protein